MKAITMCLLWLACQIGSARAQVATTLIEFTNSWRYNQSGADLGVLWRESNYPEDESWEGPGHGLLGLDNNNPPSYPPHLTSLNISDSIVTYYFRSGFNFSGPTQHVSLVASTYIDDGAVIYLNGTDVGRFRVPLNHNAATRASGGAEGVIETLIITNKALLQEGTNVVAVELHQGPTPATDLTWGMRLLLFRTTPLEFLTQPSTQNATIGQNVILTASVTGGPAFYQWQKNGVNIQGATNGSTVQGAAASSFTISNATAASSGSYRVIVTNSLGAITSEVAVVNVFEDRTGPRLVAAIINNPAWANSIPNPSNSINVIFDSPLISNPQGARESARNAANYRLLSLDQPGVEITISNALYASGVGAVLYPYTTNSAWSPNGNYYLVVNNVADTRTNVIAPNSRIAVQKPAETNLVGVTDAWTFHVSAFFDSGVYFEEWQSTNYVEGPWWSGGFPVFSGGAFTGPACLGWPSLTQTGFQPEPSLFRTTFQWPTNWPRSALLQVKVAADDAVILFLNGKEIWRTNVVGAVSPTLRSTTQGGTCHANLVVSVNNLLPGTNWLAAALVQASGADGDQSFALELGAVALLGPLLTPDPQPTLAISALNPNAVRLSWIGGGFALESSTNLNAGAGSYPDGPWEEVRKMSNPYTNSLEAPERFFRLRK